VLSDMKLFALDHKSSTTLNMYNIGCQWI